MKEGTKPHFLVATIGTRGDVAPFLDIALNLKKLGYKVSFLTNPYFETEIINADLDFFPLGTVEEYQRVMSNPALWNLNQCIEVAFKSSFTPNLEILSDFVAHLDPAEKLVIFAHPFLLPLADLARLKNKDLKIIAGALSPLLFRTRYADFALGPITIPAYFPSFFWKLLWAFLEKKYFYIHIVAPLNKKRISLGLLSVSGYISYLQEVADQYVSLFSDWFCPRQKDWPKNFISGDFLLADDSTPKALSPELQEFLNTGDKPIVFTFGTGNLHTKHLFATALQALEMMGMPARAIFLCKTRDELPELLPPTVIWQAFSPLSELLKHCSVIVYHGGIGTLAEAIRSDIPHVVIPQAFDQWDNALKVKQLGVGLSISSLSLKPKKLAKALIKIQHSAQIKERCQALSLKIKARATARDIALKIVRIF